MIRKLLTVLTVVALVGLPLSTGCAEDEIEQIEERKTTHEGPVQDVSPGQDIVE